MMLSFGQVSGICPGTQPSRGCSPRAFRAWPLAWPSPSGPLGWQRSPGSTARRRHVPRSGMRSPIRLEGPARIMRGVPPQCCGIFSGSRCTWREVTAWPWCWRAAAGYGGDRRRPVTGGCRARQPPRRRACVRRTRQSCRPATARPRVNPGRLRRVTLAALPSRLLAPVPVVHGQGRQARRAGGAPLKVVSREVVTAPDRLRVRGI
jgi:hypothetical protein